MPEVAGVALEAARLVPTCHRRGPGCLGGIGEPLARPRPHRRRRSTARRPIPGRPPELTHDQKRRIPEFLWHGPEAYGFRGRVWTCARVGRVIKEEFGIAYHKSHVSRLLKELGWTPQAPMRRALQRDEEAIRRWRESAWPELLRRARRKRRMLVFEDESGFYLLPEVVRTYAPAAQTPVLREKQTRDHLSVMSGLTPAGKVYTLVRQQSFNGTHCIEFLAPPAARRRAAALGDLGRLADPPTRGRRRVHREHAGASPRGGAAGLRAGPEPVGRGRLAPPKERGASQLGLPRPGGVA